MSNNGNTGLYAIAVVGALWAGVPLGALAWLILVVACPLGMMFMTRGMHSSGTHRNGREDEEDDDTLYRREERRPGGRS
ncbi:hypothetical protein AMK26_20005 [Streptomyces sp. CB03234]|uniref:DUF2933 domain-containing protein n=1 Tax=Streptomyces sp. (strain CB03234) TaxID=1703937 RepID=UPI000939CECA|nr:DUF2933 domain-containing protein [Streptomyces sp. CB03234]OKK03718.1 hypothetical protein AMK26_20005 [Streptomyces sp. CB03234]